MERQAEREQKERRLAIKTSWNNNSTKLKKYYWSKEGKWREKL